MNCKRTKKLMYLYREGELKTSLYRKITDHIDKCDNCRADWQKLHVSEKYIENLKSYHPVISHPEKLTADIMNAVEDQEKPVYHSGFQDLPVQWLALQKVKMTLASILIILALSFVFEYGYILNNITNLEKHISAQTTITIRDNLIKNDCFALLQAPLTEEPLMETISDYIYKKNLSRQDWLSVSKKICRYYKANQLIKNKNITKKLP